VERRFTADVFVVIVIAAIMGIDEILYGQRRDLRNGALISKRCATAAIRLIQK
jgi:hypothetical protein